MLISDLFKSNGPTTVNAICRNKINEGEAHIRFFMLRDKKLLSKENKVIQIHN